MGISYLMTMLSQYHLTTNDGQNIKTTAVCQNPMTYEVKVYLILSHTRVIPHWHSFCIFSSSPVLPLAAQYPCSSTPLAASASGPAPSPAPSPNSSLSLGNLLHTQIPEGKWHEWVLPKLWGLALGAGEKQLWPVPSWPDQFPLLEGLAGGWRLAKDKKGEDICLLPLRSHCALI